jgi:hypothetical protein
MKTEFTTLKIGSRHNSLAEAVEAAKPDLSYNPAEAARDIRRIDQQCKAAFIVESGAIYYIYSADIEILHEFEPFISVICNTPFRVAFIVGDLISISEPRIPKTQAGRNWFKSARSRDFGAIAA